MNKPSATLAIKVVPGASKNHLAGHYGDAIKVRVAAAPERGKANEAVIDLLARTLGVKASQIHIVSGHTQPRKVVRIIGITQAALDAAIGEPPSSPHAPPSPSPRSRP